MSKISWSPSELLRSSTAGRYLLPRSKMLAIEYSVVTATDKNFEVRGNDELPWLGVQQPVYLCVDAWFDSSDKDVKCAP